MVVPVKPFWLTVVVKVNFPLVVGNKKGLEIFESFVFVILFYFNINVVMLPYFATTWCVFDVLCSTSGKQL